jgi:hypothetical protein
MTDHYARPALILSWFSIAPALAAAEGGNDDFSSFIKQGTASLDFRYRYEWVDQAGFSDEAEASLLRSRLTLTSGKVRGFTVKLELDDVTSIGPNDYNSTENGKSDYPVIADPEGTELNQAWLAYATGQLTGTVGRQRIQHGSQRFVGGVAWRQNEQTFDGMRVQFSPVAGLDLDLGYVYNVNRIFGPDDGVNPADLEGDNWLLRADYALGETQSLAAFGYLLDIDDQNGYPDGKTVDNSTDTYGIEYRGKFDWLSIALAWATQSEAGDSSLNYDARYYSAEFGASLADITAKIGYEVLESDNGTGFRTPLATLHKFQGWADQFLTTPADGIEDAWAGITGKLGPVQLGAYYHDFRAESSSADFGSEWDLVATWPVNEMVTLQAKYAGFDSDDGDRFADTDKYWLTVQLRL